MKLELMVWIAVLLSLAAVITMAVNPVSAHADASVWYCTNEGVVICFRPSTVSLILPANRYLTLPSADWVQMSTTEWARFVSQFPELLPPEVQISPTGQPTATSTSSLQ